MHPDAQALIESLHLQPPPEGGFYRQTYRSPDRVVSSRGSERSALTCIYYLLTVERFSAFHVLESDETWHFYRGSPVTLELIDPAGRHERRTLSGEGPWQLAIPAKTYFAAHVDAPDGWALVGCDVAPGFEFADFRLATRSILKLAYPHLGPLIAAYTES
jgi:predicted cupin superfamily sugar epimerase